MKTQTQKTAPQKGRHNPQTRQHAAQLLTVTLDAQASACVRRFAEEFREDLRDVASGCILDTLPQALEEWEDTKLKENSNSFASQTYWTGTVDRVRAARRRRGATKAESESPDPGGPLTLMLSLSGLTQQGYLAICREEGKTPHKWLTDIICASVADHLSSQNEDSLKKILANDVEP
jgi:hypothetical protein